MDVTRNRRIWLAAILCAALLTACGAERSGQTEADEPTKDTQTTSGKPTETTQKTEPQVSTETKPTTTVPSSANIPRIQQTLNEYDPYVNMVDDGYLMLDKDRLFDYYMELIYFNDLQLRLARNSLFAHHGYVFKEEQLQSFFIQMPWYKPNPSFDLSMLSEEEKSMVDYIQSLENNPPFSLLGGDVLQWDMDKDGVEDLIQIAYQDYDNYTIHINQATLNAIGDNLAGTCGIIDINTNDNQVELLIPSMGPSSDDSFQLFRYRDGAIEDIGQVYGLMLAAPGNGYVKVRIRSNFLQTWFVESLYKVAKNGYLLKVELPEYPVASELQLANGEGVLIEIVPNFDGEPPFYSVPKLLMDLPIVDAPESATSSGVLKKGTQVVFTASTETGWVKLQAKNGTTGWFAVQDYAGVLIGGKLYPGDTVFDGLVYAD